MTFDIRCWRPRRVESRDLPQPGPTPSERSPPHVSKTPRFLLLSISITLALAACNRAADPAANAPADAAKPAETPAG